MTARPKYLPALAEHVRQTPPKAGVVHVEVRHDDDCPIFSGKPCACDAVIETGARIDEKYGADE
jgi:hypothetical protein